MQKWTCDHQRLLCIGKAVGSIVAEVPALGRSTRMGLQFQDCCSTIWAVSECGRFEVGGWHGEGWINDCNPPPSFTFLHDCHALLQQHAFLAKLETPEPTKALPVIAERLKDYATVVTLNREVCQGIMPEADSKMQAFCSAVSENALQVLGHVDSRVSAIKTLTEKYRRCLFYLFRVFLNSFVIFDLDLCIDPHGMISCFSF